MKKKMESLMMEIVSSVPPRKILRKIQKNHKIPNRIMKIKMILMLLKRARV